MNTCKDCSSRSKDSLKEIELKLYPNDLRLDECRRMLWRNGPVLIPKQLAAEMNSDDKVNIHLQECLLQEAQKSMARLFGIALVESHTCRASKAMKCTIPSLNFNGRLPGANILNEEQFDAGQQHMQKIKDLSDFLIGVKMGLSFQQNGRVIDIPWLQCNSAGSSSMLQAGVLLGVGINGNLTGVQQYSIFEYLNMKHDYTTSSLLLGLAASQQQSMDSKLTKVLSLHISDFLLPQHGHNSDGSHHPHSGYSAFHSPVNVSSLVESVAYISLGLLYAQSGSIEISRQCLQEMGQVQYRQLDGQSISREAFCLNAAFAFGLINCGKELLSGVSLGQRNSLSVLSDYINGTAIVNDGSSYKDLSTVEGCRYIDGHGVNTGITMIPALIALSLSYLNTGDSKAISIIKLPNNLHHYTHEVIFYKVLAKCLIRLYDVDVVPFNDLNDLYQMYSHSVSTVQSIQVAHCYALGLKYAGTCNKQASLYISNVVNQLKDQHKKAATISQKQQRQRILQCMNVAMIGLALVMAGSGDLKTFKMFRIIYGKYMQNGASYGDHLAVSQSIGLLFLSIGQRSIKSNPLSIAILLLSTLPSFPRDYLDNGIHLQMLRFLIPLCSHLRDPQ
ncbi:hypothetical protein MIR68_009438 [Amoeboaphelidium protococcarum]|nr:hypothetical protein MIR68_009438 [Amoeboaphelidium protococcarum]